MRILIAEDDPSSRHMLCAMVQGWGYDVVAAPDGKAAWEALQGPDAPPMALLDWMMPGMDGVDVCRAVRHREAGPYTYILLLSVRGQRKDLVYGMESGADDYLTKPFDARELQVRLRAGRRILELQEALLTTCELQRAEAKRDSLTGAQNRAGIMETIEREFARARREGTSLAVLMADLDRFKQVNDSYGHEAGDFVLREVVRRAKDEVRPYDEVGRYGGEEFLVVLPHCGDAEALKLAERIRSRLCVEPVRAAAGPVPVTASFGVATTSSLPTATSRELIRAADSAMYEAKKAGGNGVQRWGGDPPVSAVPAATQAVGGPESREDAPAFDLDKAMRYMDGDWALFCDIADRFLEHADHLLGDLRDAVGTRDCDALFRAAHKMVGSTANVHAGAAQAAAVRLEAMGRTGDLSEVGPALAALEGHLAFLEAELARCIAEDRRVLNWPGRR